MTASVYDELMGRVRRLPPAEQLRLLEDVASLLRRQLVSPRRRSILELQGLGKEIWEGIDVETYVDRERESWIG